MQKFSIEWKYYQSKKHGGWKQYHKDVRKWYWHYIQHDTEYSRPL